MFYILSLKWSKDAAALTWWRPDNKGYTFYLDEAGRYTAEQVEADRGYYDDGKHAKAIPCEVADGFALRVVPDRCSAKLLAGAT